MISIYAISIINKNSNQDIYVGLRIDMAYTFIQNKNGITPHISYTFVYKNMNLNTVLILNKFVCHFNPQPI